MGRFSGPLRTEQIGHQRWKILEGFTFTSDSGLIVNVTAGFQTDLASIPALAQGIVSKVGYWSQAAVVHDVLYYRHRSGLDAKTTRLQADNILIEGCRAKASDFSVPRLKRKDYLIYGAVRIGGLDSWETAKEKEERLSTDEAFLDG